MGQDESNLTKVEYLPAYEKHLKKIPDSPEDIWDRCYKKNCNQEIKIIFLSLFKHLEEANNLHSKYDILNSKKAIEEKIIFFAKELGNENASQIVYLKKNKGKFEKMCEDIAKISFEAKPSQIYEKFLNYNFFQINNEIISDLVYRLCMIRQNQVLPLNIIEIEDLP
ncbi:MAG TPA: hypothetical protein PLA41_02925 [Candidatus Pacearchaeota archaeon]|nr:hypothetical protein [Candidatus Parcubacteria bacterium]HNZ84177.1 hypothetical protein [Candidatus Pacearchaeota archaeon]HOU46075.1 hypothetical protein [Candidatus Pacearchaeota archaeon]HPM08618.1 hypothetical protein [Candidatus Pacearchaeota archaeon]HQI74788.1 hypothetical protein [Candidatus Pacearchaeota archaeon]